MDQPNWFYSISGVRVGPLDYSELKYLAKTGFLKESSLVWCEALPDWMRASQIVGLLNPSQELALPPLPEAKTTSASCSDSKLGFGVEGNEDFETHCANPSDDYRRHAVLDEAASLFANKQFLPALSKLECLGLDTSLCPDALLLKGRCLYETGDYANAISAFFQLGKGAIGQGVSKWLIETYQALKDHKSVAAIAQRCHDSNPDSLVGLWFSAYDDYHNGRFEVAREKCSKAIERDGDWARPYYLRAKCKLDSCKDYSESILTDVVCDLTLAISLKPDYATALCLRGTVYTDFELIGAAMQDFRTALHHEPDNWDCRMDLAKLYRRLGFLGKAIEVLIRENGEPIPPNKDALSLCVRLLYESRNYERAAAAFLTLFVQLLGAQKYPDLESVALGKCRLSHEMVLDLARDFTVADEFFRARLFYIGDWILGPASQTTRRCIECDGKIVFGDFVGHGPLTCHYCKPSYRPKPSLVRCHNADRNYHGNSQERLTFKPQRLHRSGVARLLKKGGFDVSAADSQIRLKTVNRTTWRLRIRDYRGVSCVFERFAGDVSRVEESSNHSGLKWIVKE